MGVEQSQAPGQAAGRRCARPGCRAWAMRGRAYCWAHRAAREPADAAETSTSASVGAGVGVSMEETRALFARRVEAVLNRLQSASAEPESLAEEIGALRLVLARLLAGEDDPARLASSIPRIVDTTVRAIRAQRTLSGALAESLTEALTQLLIELGLDEE